jgi:putative membrane protein
MAFGFVIERFGLFLEISGREEIKVFQRHFSLTVGISFILLAAFLSFYSTVQYRPVLKTLKPAEVPKGYNINMGAWANGIIGVLGLVLSLYVIRGFL